MPGFAPRFALEAGFLILLGAGAGYADLRPKVIVAILAGGWILVSLIELAIWRAPSRVAVGLVAAPLEDAQEPEPDADYPLRPESGETPSEEVEAYTRILDGSGDDSAAA